VDGPKKSKWAAGLLSALLPGIGHMYAGAMQRGLFFMLLLIGNITGVVLVSIEGIVPLIVLLAILIPVIYFYTLFDALQTAERVNRGTVRYGEGEPGGAPRLGSGTLPWVWAGLLFGVFWLSSGASWVEPVLEGRGSLIVAAAFIVAGLLVFAFGGRKK